jgi:hypothetical protein
MMGVPMDSQIRAVTIDYFLRGAIVIGRLTSLPSFRTA